MSVATTDITIEGDALIDGYLAWQGQLTAVDRFAQRHERGEVPAQATYYSELMPMDRPGEGQQYAFEVDLDKCSGCKACVSACHNLNGLDEQETWRDVGLLLGESDGEPVQQHVTTACHHCVDPACLEGCPVNAYDKDPVTGIVRHLDDQCIGCQYCALKCPYDVPKYHKGKGIVRKCDMCSDRLAEGEAPACVQACPTGAIAIRIIDQQAARDRAEQQRFLPGAPDPDYTVPTTTYTRSTPLGEGLVSADFYEVRPEHAHWPLVVMLVLTQLSVGGFLVGYATDTLVNGPTGALGPAHTLLALVLGLLALGASTLHLGRPMYAFRAVVGLRRSWLSREIVGFGVFAKLAMAYAAVYWLWPGLGGGAALRGLGAAVVLSGLGSVLCSVMIYHDTRRVLWRVDRTAARFFLTTVQLGLATMLLAGVLAALGSADFSLAAFMQPWGRALGAMLAGVGLTKLGFEAWGLRHLKEPEPTPMKRTAMLMTGALRQATGARFAAGALGAVVLPTVLALTGPGSADVRLTGSVIAVVFMLAVVGELLERYLFFTAVIAPRMPGGVSGS